MGQRQITPDMTPINRRTAAHPDFVFVEVPRIKQHVGREVHVILTRPHREVTGVLEAVRLEGPKGHRRYYLYLAGRTAPVPTSSLQVIYAL